MNKSQFLHCFGLSVSVLAWFLAGWFVLHYPNPMLWWTQNERMTAGMNSLVNPEDPAVVHFTQTLLLRDITSENGVIIAFFDEVPYKSDYENYGIMDYWATPNETYWHGGGDCEDQSIFLASILLRLDNMNLTDSSPSVELLPAHAYVETKTYKINYDETLDERAQDPTFYLQEDLKQLPWERTLFLGAYTMLLLIIYYQKTKKVMNNG